jgi:hypothetical protein
MLPNYYNHAIVRCDIEKDTYKECGVHPCLKGLTWEQKGIEVLCMFSGGPVMVKALLQEAAALASLALFVSMIAVWTQVLGNL